MPAEPENFEARSDAGAPDDSATLARERVLLDRLRQGAEKSAAYQDAWREFVRLYEGRLYGLARNITKDQAAAEEVVQETFLIFYRQVRRGKFPDQNTWGWLGTAAFRLGVRVLDKKRKSRQRAAAVREVLGGEYAQRAASARLTEVKTATQELLDGLPDNLRVPTVLYFAGGMNQADIAAQLRCSQVTVSERIQTALARLRAGLKRAGYESLPAALPVLLTQALVRPPMAVPAGLSAKLAILPQQAAAGVFSAGNAAVGAAALTWPLKAAALAVFVAAAGYAGWEFTKAWKAPLPPTSVSAPESSAKIAPVPAPYPEGETLLSWNFDAGIPSDLHVFVAYDHFFQVGVEPGRERALALFGDDLSGVEWAEKEGLSGGGLRVDKFRGVVWPIPLDDQPLAVSFDFGRSRGFLYGSLWQPGEKPVETLRFNKSNPSGNLTHYWNTFVQYYWTEGTERRAVSIQNAVTYGCHDFALSGQPGCVAHPYVAGLQCILDNLRIYRPTSAELRVAQNRYAEGRALGPNPLVAWDFDVSSPATEDLLYFDPQGLETQTTGKTGSRQTGVVKNKGVSGNGFRLDEAALILPTKAGDWPLLLSFQVRAFENAPARMYSGLWDATTRKTATGDSDGSEKNFSKPEKADEWRTIVFLYAVIQNQRTLICFNQDKFSMQRFPRDFEPDFRLFFGGKNLLIDNVRLEVPSAEEFRIRAQKAFPDERGKIEPPR
jgi:RNA polymerase sigma-70 factor (ECF subfamily)